MNKTKTFFIFVLLFLCYVVYNKVKVVKKKNDYCVLDAYPVPRSSENIYYIYVRRHLDGTLEECNGTKEFYYRYDWSRSSCTGPNPVFFKYNSREFEWDNESKLFNF